MILPPPTLALTASLGAASSGLASSLRSSRSSRTCSVQPAGLDAMSARTLHVYMRTLTRIHAPVDAHALALALEGVLALHTSRIHAVYRLYTDCMLTMYTYTTYPCCMPALAFAWAEAISSTQYGRPAPRSASAVAGGVCPQT